MILKQTKTLHEYAVYTNVNGKLRCVGVFFGTNQCRNYCGKYYNDWKIEKVIK